MQLIGRIKLIRRYPVKSMMGEDLAEARVTSTGLVGDRIYAFVDETNKSGFPWLTVRQANGLVLFKPQLEERPSNRDRVRVTTPEGKEFDILDPEFAKLLAERFGRPVHFKYSKKGIHDSNPISLIGFPTLKSLDQEMGIALDLRRFRMNLYAEWDNGKPFYEDELVGKTLQIGEEVKIQVAKKDLRCKIITVDPETSVSNMEILASVAKNHGGRVGVYSTVEKEGTVRVGDGVYIEIE